MELMSEGEVSEINLSLISSSRAAAQGPDFSDATEANDGPDQPIPPPARPAKAKGAQPKGRRTTASGPQSKQWCFTMNNYTMTQVNDIILKAQADERLQYIVFQPERGAQGTPHLQGYVAFVNRRARSTVKNWLGDNRAHLEVTRGTPKQASYYCKEDKMDPDAGFGVFEYGVLPTELNLQHNGQRLLQVKEFIDNGHHVWDIPALEPSCYGTIINNHNALEKYEMHVTAPRSKQTDFIVLWGTTGTYKSTAAKRVRNAYFLQPGNNGLWWGGYIPAKHPNVVLDDFDGRWCRPGDLKRIINHLPCTVETKGGVRQFTASSLYITSNWSPLEWWKNPKPQDIEPIQRRITAEFQHTVNPVLVFGVPLHTVLVNKVKGGWYHHPLSRYLVRTDAPGIRRLDMDAFAEVMDTLPTLENQKEYYLNNYL